MPAPVPLGLCGAGTLRRERLRTGHWGHGRNGEGIL